MKGIFFSFFFFSFYQRGEIFTGLGCGLGVEFLVYERYCCGFESVGTFRLKKKKKMEKMEKWCVKFVVGVNVIRFVMDSVQRLVSFASFLYARRWKE